LPALLDECAAALLKGDGSYKDNDDGGGGGGDAVLVPYPALTLIAAADFIALPSSAVESFALFAADGLIRMDRLLRDEEIDDVVDGADGSIGD
jgi:hypothetical protein